MIKRTKVRTAKILFCFTLFFLLVLLSGSVIADTSCCDYYDPGNTYPCYGGNCTWWAAYKRPETNFPGTDRYAMYWLDLAEQNSLPIGNRPKIGSIAVFENMGEWGHVAYVEEVYEDTFRASEMCWGGCFGWCEVRYHTYHINEVSGFIFPADNVGWVSVSEGVNVSPTPVVLGEDFTVSFTLQEINGAPKTFEQVAIAILWADDSLLFDLAMYNNVTIPANGIWSRSATSQIWDTNPPGTYKAIIRGKIDGQWFDFDTTGSGVNPRSFTAVDQIIDGYASVSQGVTVTPAQVVLGQDFTINFTLKETRGVPKTFEQVAVAILREDNSLLFDFAMYYNITVPASGTWSASPTNVIYYTNPPGTYKAMIRGKVSGGEWFDFDVIENGVNPRNFPTILPVQDDNYEENDSSGAAYDLSNRERTWLQNIAGLGVQADDDWFMIYVSPGYERVQVDLQFTHSEGDIDVALYDAVGNYLASSTGVVDNEFLDFIVPGSGTHYIKVYYADAGNTYNLWWDDLFVLKGDYDSDNDVDGSDLADLAFDFMNGVANESDLADFVGNFGTN